MHCECIVDKLIIPTKSWYYSMYSVCTHHHRVISLRCIHATHTHCLNREIIFTEVIYFFISPKSQSKIIPRSTVSISLWLFGKHKNHFITVKNIFNSIRRIISLWSDSSKMYTTCIHTAYTAICRIISLWSDSYNAWTTKLFSQK